MSIFSKQQNFDTVDDETLVLHSLGGDKRAFCEIVVRYQTLLCSIAFSAVGDLKHSEDLAQDAFIEAWKKLDSLNDPIKLKSWLCGILRFKVSHFRRRPTNRQNALTVDDVQDIEQIRDNATVEKEAMQKQEQSLLWSTLNQLDSTYREPLILFYRENQSIERVAEELDLSKDTAKQRLSRGRKLLKEAMSVFVEDALSNSKPSVAFTAGVMALVNTISPPAKAAALGASAYQSGVLAKFSSILHFLAPLSGIISSLFSLRANLYQARTSNERRNAVMTVVYFFLFTALYIAGIFILKHLALSSENTNTFLVLSQVSIIGLVASYLILMRRIFHDLPRLRASNRIKFPHLFENTCDREQAKEKEYVSSFCLLNIPLCHFQFGMPELNDKPAIAWIAGGPRAYGMLFAWGGIAIAPISVGIISVGIVSIGAIGIGILGLGTVAVGLIAFGASAIGYKAYASLTSTAWESAFSNGFSIAKDAAIGPIAYAQETNNDLAAAILDLEVFGQGYPIALLLISLLVIVPSILYSRKVRQRMKV